MLPLEFSAVKLFRRNKRDQWISYQFLTRFFRTTKLFVNKAKRSAKQQRPDVPICFLLASWRSNRAKRLKQNNKSYSAQLLTAAAGVNILTFKPAMAGEKFPEICG